MFAKQRSALTIERATTRHSLLTELLQEFGFPLVVPALSPANALERLQLISFDLVVVEINNADDPGFDFVRQVRFGADDIRRLPIVVVSGDTTRAFVAKVRDHGASALLLKPFSRASVAQQVGRALDEQRQFVFTAAFAGPDRRRCADPTYRGPERRAAAALLLE